MATGSSAHPTIEQRRKRGRAARKQAPRSSHVDWAPGADRADPVELLEQQATTRVPELVPIRYGRMSASAFPFFRGAAYPMAADLATMPSSGLEVQLCGDAHLSNFGVFAAPDRQLVFDLNDFDETLPGPFEWDLKRLAASIAVAGRELGIARKRRRATVASTAMAYRETIRATARMRNLDVWYTRVDIEQVLAASWGPGSAKAQARAERNLRKARGKDSLRALAKLTREVDGEPRLISDPPLVVPIKEVFHGLEAERVEQAIETVLRAYRDSLRRDVRRLVDGYRLVDVAHKVVGVGSVGARAWIALFLGQDHGDPLFLQLKEAQASVLEPFLKRSRFGNHGRRVVEGQRLLQTAPDIMLGWTAREGEDGVERHFYVRQLWDAKGSADVEAMSATTLGMYGRLCGATLARGHARSGDRFAIAAYLGSGTTFDEAIAEFAESYADQNERDHAALVEAIASGRIKAETGI